MAWNYLSIPKLQRFYRWSLGIDKWFHLVHYNVCNWLSMLGLRLNHVSKRVSRLPQCSTLFQLVHDRVGPAMNQLMIFSFIFSFELMLQCWKDIPRERPAFETIRKVIDNYLMKDSDYLVLTCDAEVTSENSSPTTQSLNGHSQGIGDSVSLGDQGYTARLSPARDQERTVSVTDLTHGDVECGNTVSDFSGAKNSPSTSFVADVAVPTETYL